MTLAVARRRPATPAVGVNRTKFHLYYFNGAGPWPGVTSITKVLDAPALTSWKLNQVALSAVENAERLVADREAGKTDAAVKYLTTLSTSAMDRGSRIHGSIESILRARDRGRRPARRVRGRREARAWLNQQQAEHAFRLLEVEAFLINETEGYGGTLDLIASIDGETWLLDWKTGKTVAGPDGKVYQDHRLQLAAYARSEFIADGQRPGALPHPLDRPLRHRPRYRRRDAAVRGQRHAARLVGLPVLPRALRLEAGEGGGRMRLMSIDPGTTQSAWLIYRAGAPVTFGILPNADLLEMLRVAVDRLTLDVVVIEQVESYGMAVGREVFETVRWAGRFEEAAHPVPVALLPRRTVKLHLCGLPRANDGNVRMALLDRFGGREPPWSAGRLPPDRCAGSPTTCGRPSRSR